MHEDMTLPLLLKELKLRHMLSQWQPMAEQALSDHWSYTHYLSALCEYEAAERQTRRIERNRQASKLPPGKTLASFDFNYNKQIAQSQVNAICEDISWVRQAHNILLFGPSGVGKTHLVSAIGHAVLNQGIRVLFRDTTALIQQLQQARQACQQQSLLSKLDRFSLLILDEISYVRKNEMESQVLFELIAHRYETGSIAFTSNKPFSEWDQIFPDTMMVVAAVDRLIHHATIINIEGESYRKAQAQKNSIQKGKQEETMDKK